MRDRTGQNTINAVIGTAPLEILGPNPKRKSFLLTPLTAATANIPPLTAVVFGAGVNQTWTVPANVTQIVDAFAWGAGGNAGAPDLALGGGGGGGGSWANTGPITVVPGSTFLVSVDAGGLVGLSSIASPSAVVLASASSGNSGVLNAAGVGGIATVGAIREAGGNGAAATLLAGSGGGGGGAGGAFVVGGAGVASAGGIGGGGAVLLGHGKGGNGGIGSQAGGPGGGGALPGGGAGGSAVGGGAAGTGANGRAVIFFVGPPLAATISLSHRQDVAAGVGVLNYLTGQEFPTFVTDDDIGDAVGLPWWIVSSVNGVPVQIVEYSYDE